MLALWEYFWDWDGTATATTATDAAGRANAGGGGKKSHYEPAGEDFWAVRERYLRRFVEPARIAIEKTVSIENNNAEAGDPAAIVHSPATVLLRQAFDVAANRAAVAQNMGELREVALRLRALALDISEIEQQNYDRAIALLLLDVF